MATINEIRRENLYGLIQDKFGGNKRQFALAVGVAPNTIQRIFSSSVDNRRNVGDAMARQIEEYFDLVEGWMDSENKHGPLAGNLDRESKLPYPTEDELKLFSEGKLKPSKFQRVFKTTWNPIPNSWAYEITNRANEPRLMKGVFVAVLPGVLPATGEFGLYLIGGTPMVAQNTSLGLEFVGVNPAVPDGEQLPIGVVLSTLPVQLANPY